MRGIYLECINTTSSKEQLKFNNRIEANFENLIKHFLGDGNIQNF